MARQRGPYIAITLACGLIVVLFTVGAMLYR
jgi:hypothetical protein